MDLSTGIFWLGALALLGIAYWKAPGIAADGLRSGAGLLWSVLPRLLAAFAIAGLIQTGWSLLGLHRILAWELPLLGPRFVGIRLAVSLVLPPLAGYLAGTIARR